MNTGSRALVIKLINCGTNLGEEYKQSEKLQASEEHPEERKVADRPGQHYVLAFMGSHLREALKIWKLA